MLDTMTALNFQEAPAEPITIDPDYSIKGLVAAVIIQAVRDAARGDPGAVEWLKWDGLAWCEAVGFDAEQTIKKWILEGCKKPEAGSKAHRPTRTRKPARKPRKSRQEARSAIYTA